MPSRRIAAALAVAVAGALCSSSARAEERVLTVEQVVQLVEQNNPRVLQYLAQAQGGRDLARSAGGKMLPSFHVNEEYQLWNEAYIIPFGKTVFPVRDQNTNALSVSADQPLLGLLRLSHEHDAQARAAEATDAQLETARADLKAAVESQYLHLFEARAFEEIAQASQKELSEQVAVTQAKLTAGVLTTADLLRVQVAVANARQQELQAKSQEEIARANLLGAIGLPQEDVTTRFSEPSTLLARSRESPPKLAEAQTQAMAQRPELKQKLLQVDALRQTEKARLFSLLPEVDAEAAYLRTDGSIFNPANAGFVGVKASWAIFEWGASWYARKAAAEQTEAARRDAESEARAIGIEVSSDLAQASVIAAVIDVAQQTITSAEEAYRVTQALLKAGSATTTDLLDAEAALTQARLNLTRARYEQAVAAVTLGRSLGAR
jgi:outer membrane protein TolC